MTIVGRCSSPRLPVVVGGEFQRVSCRLARCWALVTLVVLVVPLRAAEPPQPPQVLFSLPLAVVCGEPVKVRARGLLLEGVTEARSTTAGVTAMLVSQGKVGVPTGVPAAKAGDTQVELEIRFTPDLPAPPPTDAAIVLVAPHGETTLRLPLLAPDHASIEVEPNAGFAKPQLVILPAAGALTILGQIDRPQDVDVFRLDLGLGQRLRFTVASGSLGSLLDPLVTLHDAGGSPLATADDGSDSRDPVLEITAPHSGAMFLVIQDANDAGGEAHPYRLTIESVAAVSPAAAVSFVRDVAPILQSHCVACHGPGQSEGEWRADSLVALLAAGASGAHGFAAGNRAASAAFDRITATDPDLRMPMDGEPLSAPQIDAIARWIDAGLPFDGTASAAPLVEQIPPPLHPPAPQVYATLPPVTGLAFTPSGALLVGGWREVLVIDPAAGLTIRRIGNLAERSSRIAVHPAGDRFAVAGGIPGRLGEVRLFNLAGDVLRVLAPGADIVHDVAWSPSGDRLAVASSDATVRIFDAESGSLLRAIAGHRDWVLAVAWSPDGGRIASGSRDRTAKVFDADTGTLVASYGRHDAPVRGIVFHPSGAEVYSAGDAQKWDRWKIAEAAHVRDSHLGGEVFQLVTAGEFVAAPSASGKVQLLKAEESDAVREYQMGTAGRLVSVAASLPADLVAAGTQDGRVVVWRLSTGEKMVEFPAQPSQ